MKWTKLTIKTTTEAEDIIIADLYEIGLEGAQIEDHIPLTAWEKEQMFVDILPEGPADDGIAYLSFFIEVPDENDEADEAAMDLQAGLTDNVDNSYFLVSSGKPVDVDALRAEVARRLEDISMYCNIGEGTITIGETEDKDWLNNWKNYFHQFCIDDLLVIPSWESVKEEDQDKKILHIDPGTAFGTGMHETTQLCIRQLKKFINDDTVLLDIGTGSGILAIVSMLYGIDRAVGTDLDPCATEAVRENLENNGIDPSRFEMMIGNIITDKAVQDRVGYEMYDVVVANILAEVLVALAPVVKQHMKPDAVFITSGIVAEKEDFVVEEFTKAGLEVVEVTHQGEWVSVTAKRA